MKIALTHWNCEQCKAYNDILTNNCRLCNTYKPDWLTAQYQCRVELSRGIFYSRGFTMPEPLSFRDNKNMTEEEKLFAEFYSSEKILVKDMDLTELREHRDVLAKICLEAKARLVATDDDLRERKSKSRSKDWLVSVDENANATDAINAVKVRKERMSKLDKHRMSLLAMGMDKEIVDEMIAKMEKKATEQQLGSVTFKVPTPEKKVVQIKAELSEADKKPFNASSLKFGS